MGAIGQYAKEQNKLVKIYCDDYKARAVLRKQLQGVAVEYGVEGQLEAELEMEMKTGAQET